MSDQSTQQDNKTCRYCGRSCENIDSFVTELICSEKDLVVDPENTCGDFEIAVRNKYQHPAPYQIKKFIKPPSFLNTRKIIEDARRSGYYKGRPRTFCLMGTQKWVEDQMTGDGHIEGDSLGGDIGITGYVAEIEMKNGYKASLYMSVEQIEGDKKYRGNMEDFVLARLIQTNGLQINQEKPTNER